jgi:pyrimidine operon attenuation protein/uracil phosphoribosyltransferase
MQPILDNTAIHQKINRLAHELSEDCYQESLIFIGGIHGNGIELAKRLQTGMSEILSNDIDLFEIFVNKEEPWKEAIRLSVPEE